MLTTARMFPSDKQGLGWEISSTGFQEPCGMCGRVGGVLGKQKAP